MSGVFVRALVVVAAVQAASLAPRSNSARFKSSVALGSQHAINALALNGRSERPRLQELQAAAAEVITSSSGVQSSRLLRALLGLLPGEMTLADSESIGAVVLNALAESVSAGALDFVPDAEIAAATDAMIATSARRLLIPAGQLSDSERAAALRLLSACARRAAEGSEMAADSLLAIVRACAQVHESEGQVARALDETESILVMLQQEVLGKQQKRPQTGGNAADLVEAWASMLITYLLSPRGGVCRIAAATGAANLKEGLESCIGLIQGIVMPSTTQAGARDDGSGGGGGDTWKEVKARREAKAQLLQDATAFNLDAKQAVARWRADGWFGPEEPSGPASSDGQQAKSPPPPPGEGEGGGAALGRLLFAMPGLSAATVGDYLARPDAFARAALAAFMACFDFTGMALDAALRLTFAALHVPGEAQKIDRVVNAFANAYFKQEPGPFADPTATYVTSFSAMLLNTDLHNPAIRTKMSLESFVKNIRGINNGTDLPREYLEGLYHAIATNEIKAHEMPPPSSSSSSPQPAMAPGGGPLSAPPPAVAQRQPSTDRSLYLQQRELVPLTTPHATFQPSANKAAMEALRCEELQEYLLSQVVPIALDLAATAIKAGSSSSASSPQTAPPAQSYRPPQPSPTNTLVANAAGMVKSLAANELVAKGNDLVTNAAGVVVKSINSNELVANAAGAVKSLLQLPNQPPPRPGAVVGGAHATARTSGGDEWVTGIQVLLLCLKVSVRFQPPAASRSLIDRAVTLLCDASRLPSSLGYLESPELVERLRSRHSLTCACSAVALAAALPQHLGRDGWYAIVRTLLVLNQLSLIPAPMPTPQGGHGKPTNDEPPTSSGGEPQQQKAMEGAAVAIERMLSASWPSPSDPPWQTGHALQAIVGEAVRPVRVVEAALAKAPSQAPSSPAEPASHTFLSALVRTLDENLHMAFASRRASAADAAAKALSLLVAAVEHVGREATPPWALGAAQERAGRALSMPGCPPAIHAAASHAMAQMHGGGARPTTSVQQQQQQQQRPPPPSQQQRPYAPVLGGGGAGGGGGG